MTVRLTIGELSKMTYLSVKALRHYHEVGLLEPAEIDPSSGYRRYTADQVATAQAIRRFRDLDMPLDQVRTVLSAPDAATRNATILAHLEAMQAKLERTQQTVASLHALLSGGRPLRPITYRTLAAQPALAVRATVAFADAGAWLEDGLATVHRVVEGAGLTPAGSDGALYEEAFFTEGVGEVVGFVPLEAGRRPDDLPADPAGDRTSAGDRVVAVDLPATRVAAMVHDGPFDDLDQTYGALGTVVAELGLGADGPIREIYLADDRAEVCWPITPTTTTTTTTGSTP